MKTNARFLPFTVLVGLVAFLGAASAQADDPTPRLAPIHTKPAGQTYGRWAAEWWQWALGIPGAVNPLTDPTGAHCGISANLLYGFGQIILQSHRRDAVDTLGALAADTMVGRWEASATLSV
jgi:hypothetical protein